MANNDITIVAYESVLKGMQLEFPKLQIVKKGDSWFMLLISKLLFFNKTFMTGYVTTIGNKIYVPDDWDDHKGFSQAATLRHERVHLQQQRRYTFPLYVVLYLLLLPVVFTFRARLEKEAYEESMKAWFEYYGETIFTLRRKEHILKQFIGPSYGWMHPFTGSMDNWYDGVVDRLKGRTN